MTLILALSHDYAVRSRFDASPGSLMEPYSMTTETGTMYCGVMDSPILASPKLKVTLPMIGIARTIGLPDAARNARLVSEQATRAFAASPLRVMKRQAFVELGGPRPPGQTVWFRDNP